MNLVWLIGLHVNKIGCVYFFKKIYLPILYMVVVKYIYYFNIFFQDITKQIDFHINYYGYILFKFDEWDSVWMLTIVDKSIVFMIDHFMFSKKIYDHSNIISLCFVSNYFITVLLILFHISSFGLFLYFIYTVSVFQHVKYGFTLFCSFLWLLTKWVYSSDNLMKR